MATQRADGDLVAAGQQWAAALGAAPLDPADAADLMAGALKVTQAAAHAARDLSWQTPDAFVVAMRQAEQANEC